jgi:hypothetical protein
MSVVGNKNTFVIEINEDTKCGTNRLLYENTRLICTDTKALQQLKQSTKPVTTYSVLTQKTSTQKKLELDRVLYSHWRNIDTSAYLNHYTIMSIILV